MAQTFIFSPSVPASSPASVCTDDLWSVGSAATIIVPSDPARKRFSLYHESAADLLIDFNQNPTLSVFAFALPGFVVYSELDWVGQVRAISRTGATINIHVRSFYAGSS